MLTDTDNLRYRLGNMVVSRIGYGAMQLSGDGVFGPPGDRDEAIAVLRTAIETGVDHIDTAHYYGRGVVNELIREALHPYPAGLALVSKVAARRDETGAVLPYDEPHELRHGIEDNLRTLGVEQLAVVNLRVMDNAAPDGRFFDQLGAMVAAREARLIGGIGLSNISYEHLVGALEITEIVCVQNSFSLAERKSLSVLGECDERGIAFVPFCPLGWPSSQHDDILTNSVVTTVARHHGATAGQVVLAWLLALAPNVLLIPGTSRRPHLRENLAAGALSLEQDEIVRLTQQFQ
jgi:pyridoxine 4-dehydrogenase